MSEYPPGLKEMYEKFMPVDEKPSNMRKRIHELESEISLFRITLSRIINDLPTNKDWLDPVVEIAAKELVKGG